MFSLLRIHGNLHSCKDLQRDIIPWTNLRNNTSRECSRICFRDVVNLLLSKLPMNACMRDLWVRQGLIHGMLLRSLGSFLRCDDTFGRLWLW